MNHKPLNPCPNCGNKCIRLWHYVVPGRKYFCECTQCHWTSKARYFKCRAVRAWNRQKKVK